MNYILTLVIVLITLLSNALMDAIDHAKGDKPLYELWHVLKMVSYAVPFGYIIYLTKPHWSFIIIVILYWWLLWELAYGIFRTLQLWEWDDKLKIKLLQWIWRIKRMER